MNSGIYCIKNLINGKVYIGSSCRIEHRHYSHFYLLKKKNHANHHLQKAFDKYGEPNFEFLIIESVEIPKLIAREQYWIDYYDATNADKGYNIRPRADGHLLSEETKKKLSLFHLGKKTRPHSEETKRKIGLSNMGKTHMIGNQNPFFGKKHTKETKTRLSILAKKRLEDPTKNPMYGVHLKGKLNPMFGRTGEKSPHWGKKLSESTKLKMRNSALKLWEKRK